MAIKVSGTTVIDDSRGLNNIASVDATTVAALGAAGVGGGGGVFDMTATGAISSGDLVALNTDGTVSSVAATETYRTEINVQTTGLGSADTFGHGYDPDQEFLLTVGNTNNFPNEIRAYSRNANDPGQFNSGGQQQSMDSRNQSTEGSAVYDTTNDKFIVIYCPNGGDNNSSIFARVVTADSSKNLTQGTAYKIRDDGIDYRVDYQVTLYVPSLNKVFNYQDRDGGGNNVICGGITSGYNMSWGSSIQTSAQAYPKIDLFYDTGESRLGMIWYDNSSQIKFQMATVSGNTLTLLARKSSNDVTLTPSAFTGGFKALYDSDVGKIIFLWDDYGSNTLKVRLGDLNASTNTITWSSDTTVHSDGGSDSSVASPHRSLGIVKVDGNKYKFLITYKASGTNTYYSQIMTISGSTITFNTRHAEGSTDEVNGKSLFFDSGNPYYKVVMAPIRTSGSFQGELHQMQLTQTTSNNVDFIGIAGEAISNGATGEIKLLGGVSDEQSGLTPKSVYYAAQDGTLTTSNTGYKVGTALTSSAILITRPD